MRWWLPRNWLGRDVILEVTVSTDRQGQTKRTVATLDPDAPPALVVSSLLAAAGSLYEEAAKLAGQHKIKLPK